jgi:hypothetical protein
MTRYLLLFDNYGSVSVRPPLWRDDRSVFSICYWPSPVQSFLGPRPFGLETVFYWLRFKTSLFVASYDTRGHGGDIWPRLLTDLSSLYRLHTDHTENSSHVIAIWPGHWRPDCCLATRCKICSLRHSFHCSALEHVYRTNPLHYSCSVTEIEYAGAVEKSTQHWDR